MLTLLYVYLAIGLVYSTTMLYMMRNIPASFLVMVRDGINCTLFWPYISQLQWDALKRAKRAHAQLAKFDADFAKDPEAFKQETLKAVKKLEDLIAGTNVNKTGTNDEKW